MYAYEFGRPPPEDQLGAIRAFLDEEHSAARRADRTWTGKLVCDGQLTHILVVSDTPDQSREVNRQIERQLSRLQAVFSLTAPMVLDDGEDASLEGRANSPVPGV
jgi:hypothetical protein